MVKLWPKIDHQSLQVRLIAGVATVSTMGLGSVVTWMSWQIQHLLVETHKQNLEIIANRFPRDVEIYSDMVSLETGIQKAVNNLTNYNTLLWVKNSVGTITAKSQTEMMISKENTLTFLSDLNSQPKLQKIQGDYWLLCAVPLVVKKNFYGQLYIAHNITSEQTMFLHLTRSLSLSSLLAIGVMLLAITWYVRKSLKPLHRISEITQSISVDKLKDAQIQLENAPSEIKQLVQTYEQMLSRLSQSWEQQQQLVSNVSHELRTPLTIVSGYLQSLLRRGDNLTSSQREAIEVATSEANRTIQLLQDLLDLERADSGRMHFYADLVNLNNLLIEVVEMTKKFSDRICLLELPEQIITITVNEHRLKQSLLNLIDNAIKYSEPNTPITLRLEHSKEQVTIQVCDQGIGIPLQQQVRIFERFYRVDEARTRTTGGSGLGLSIVKTFIEGMGGTVSVYSRLNKGSIFSIIFPL
ncbi:HAMP domain-containing sensor histidine kinase [Chroococcus sp. FPU101]|uniref:HAMP domain-containing sensor histidine kinase n=1 Tax=Chroococcus sp. FPU101 TaxID=1974212 RepID=UPI001A8D70F5|nr:HAMP domain-containing sensor histidine kinase [Chroococcus sp. FPU101]GFE71225.1 integral membrane sensor signal transduction histidine kinase [Chroococcus sp. FPU101]